MKNKTKILKWCFALLLICLQSVQVMAQKPLKISATLNRDELKKLREMVQIRYRDTVIVDKDAQAIAKTIETSIGKQEASTIVNNVEVKDLLAIAESYAQDFIDVETKKKGRNNFIRIMKMIREQDPNLTSILASDGYTNRTRMYVPLILEILDKEKK